MTGERIISLEGVHNFRDFGGWPVLQGGRVRPGVLFRSGHLARATKADLETIDGLGLQALADLRQPAERAREPNRLPSAPPATILQSAKGGYDEAPHVQFLREADLSASAVRAYMISAYRRIPTESHHQQIFAQVFRTLMHGRPLLVHCAAGKDRTGILAALVLLALGVDEETVMEDYLLTNAAVDIDALLPAIAKRISAQSGKPVEPQALRPMLGVEADFLRAALAVTGPPERYLETVLGIGKREREALRRALLA